MERVDNAVLRSGPFAHHEQVDLGLRVVEEAVRDPGAGRKSNAIARPQPMEMAVDPHVGRAFDDVDELFLRALGVRKGRAPPRWQSLVMDAQPGQAEMSAESRADAHQLVVFVVVPVVWLLDPAPVSDKGRALWR